ncbi:MAG: hypothetical protein PUB97_07380 [Ruminococcus sp.]|nr:hypothetical protein [Ruminococcus sp.]
MMNITEKELDILVKKEKKPDNLITIFNNAVGKFFFPIIVIEIVASIFIEFVTDINVILIFLLFIIADAALLFLIPLFIIFRDSEKLIRKIGGNFKDSITLTRFSIKYGSLQILFANEICSDKYISAIDKKLEEEKNHKFLASLNSMKVSALYMQVRFTEADLIVEELRSKIETVGTVFTDIPMHDIISSMRKNDDRAFIRAIEKHKDYIEQQKNISLTYGINYAFICAYEHHISNDNANALRYIELAEKYNNVYYKILSERSKPYKESNTMRYNRAAYKLEKANYLYHLGRYAEALEASETIIAELECEIPPIFKKEYNELLESLSSIRIHKSQE